MPQILLAEDNDLNRDMLARALARFGYDIALAEDGLRAVSMARTLHPDLILMDLSLPEIDGWEATRRLKSDGETRDIPVIALTAHAMPDDRAKALAAGCDEYDTKPVDVPHLHDKIEALLADRPRSATQR